MATKKTSSQNKSKPASASAKKKTAAPKKAASKASATPKPGQAPKKKPGRPPKKVEFKPDAVDGDGDGLVQDNTVHERPAFISFAPTTEANSAPAKVILDTPATSNAPIKKKRIWSRLKFWSKS